MLVDARVRLRRQPPVHGPGDFQRREIVGIRSRAQQPQRLGRAVAGLRPRPAGRRWLVDVGAEHAAAVLRAQHRRRHAHVLRARPSRRVRAAPRRRPRRARARSRSRRATSASSCARRADARMAPMARSSRLPVLLCAALPRGRSRRRPGKSDGGRIPARCAAHRCSTDRWSGSRAARSWARRRRPSRTRSSPGSASTPCPRSSALRASSTSGSILWVVNVGGVHGQAAADVAADLADPHLLAVIAHRAQPQPQVVALVDVVARLLQGEVLRAAEQVEVAHRRIGVALAGQRGASPSSGSSPTTFLGRPPAAPREGGEGVVEPAHDHQVERVTVLRAVLVDRRSTAGLRAPRGRRRRR